MSELEPGQFDDPDQVEPEPASSVYDLSDPAQRSTGFAEAKRALARSGLVVIPTDTVYGLAADAFDPTGVRRLLRAKGRGRDMPTPVLIGSVDTLRALATNVGPDARDLAAAFWPGGLTLICRQQPSLRWDLGDSRATVALRMPDHEDTLALLSDNGPLAVSSANLTGSPAATTVEEAQLMLGDRVDVYLDAGPTPGTVASTIVDCSGPMIRVVRAGVITAAQLREVVPGIVVGDDAPRSRSRQDVDATDDESSETEQAVEAEDAEGADLPGDADDAAADPEDRGPA